VKEIETFERSQMKEHVAEFAPGDTVNVTVEIVEPVGTGGKATARKRTQTFQGIVIRRHGSGSRETFTVRKISFGVGVERTFPVHSPIVQDISVVSRGDVRRAKLYYLRDKVGRAARVKKKKFRVII